MLRGLALLLPLAFVSACGQSAPDDTSEDALRGDASAFLAETLATLASPDRPFFINRGVDRGVPDPRKDRVLGGIFDPASRTFSIDFRPVVSLLPPGGDAETLSRVFTFTLADVSSQGGTLDDLSFSRRFGDAVYRSHAARLDARRAEAEARARKDDLDPAEPESGDGTSDPNAFISAWNDVMSRYGACAAQGFPATVPYAVPQLDGPTEEVELHCDLFQRQSGSQMTVTPFELASLMIYTGRDYAPINRLLRSRTFGAVDPASLDDPELEEHATHAVWALGTLSAIHKLDKQPTRTYRGVNAIFPTCAKNGPALAPAPTTPAGAIARFCGYFAELSELHDCGFGSSSMDPEVALTFAGVSRVVGTNGRETVYLDVRPTDGAIGILYEIEGRTAVPIPHLSFYPHEREVLFRPGVTFRVDRTSRRVAFFPPDAGPEDHTSLDAFETVACGEPLSEEQLGRLSHFRVSLLECQEPHR